jgi:hypothetical protein
MFLSLSISFSEACWHEIGGSVRANENCRLYSFKIPTEETDCQYNYESQVKEGDDIVIGFVVAQMLFFSLMAFGPMISAWHGKQGSQRQ